MIKFKPVKKDDYLFTELVPRLIAIDKRGGLHSFGTCFIFQPYLALTARHVILEFFKLDPQIYKGEKVNFNFWAIQTAWEGKEHNYIVWEVRAVSISAHTDLAILELHPYCKNSFNYKHWKSPRCTLIPPKIGSQVIGFGYHQTSFEGSRLNSEGKVEHIAVNDQASSSRGIVKNIYQSYRDRGMLNFSCIEVDARLDPGMSGGPVINEDSEVFGIICSSLQSADETQVATSFVTLLWPMMAMKIDIGLSIPGFTHREQYLLELSRARIFTPKGWEYIRIEEIPDGHCCNVSISRTLFNT
jgi:hypothetical protein